MRGTLKRLGRAQEGSIAPIVALSLVGLIAAGGLAVDFAQLANLDTELQNAADQSALAGVTQLDGQDGAMRRATAAARALVANDTRFANDAKNDDEGQSAVVAQITFYATAADAEANTNPLVETAAGEEGEDDVDLDTLAKFIRVDISARQARYAMTPIVGLLNSGDVGASAVAGLGTAICKTPPVMMCNPAEPDDNEDEELDFDADALRGTGVLLIAGDANAPGNFGFLDTGIDQGNSTPELAKTLGYNVSPGECQPISGVDLKTGARDVVLNAFNTRFDIYANGENTCPDGGSCLPSRNSRKDLVKGNSCTLGGGQGWVATANPYRPTSGTPLTSGYPDIMGHPRDICHARATEANPGQYCTATNGSLNGRIGDKLWDRDAYFRVNYGWTTRAAWKTATGLSDNATRYEVYQWELRNPDTADQLKTIGGKNAYSYPICQASGVTPDDRTPDRRRISVAVLNCGALGLNGAEKNQPVLKWVDVFLVEPAVSRKRGSTAVTGQRDVYVELIGETVAGGAGETAGQVVRRDKPYLLK